LPILEEYRLTNKVAIVAGDGTLDTNAFTPYLVEVLAEAGARVFVAASSADVMGESVRRANVLGGEAHGILCDHTSEHDVEMAFIGALDHFGRVDILVNNLRTEFGKPFDQVTVTEYETVMDRNVRSVFLTCRAAGTRMLRQGSGRIINILSGLAERGLSNSAAYCASQGAVLQLTKALALEWGRQNVRVNAIGIGWFSSEELPPEEAQKELLVRFIPLRRRGHPRDIAPALVYLASDSCDYTTGQPIYIDGGLMAHP
jgi:NAD(P)-dependent dehydrogenase (short-subunit alcohol dehydrogenase family)